MRAGFEPAALSVRRGRVSRLVGSEMRTRRQAIVADFGSRSATGGLPLSAEDGSDARWRFFCRRCDAGWSMPKGDPHPVNVLRLLDHAHSHLEN
jgi:hypothetical protein